jgi:GTPase KRas protein
MDRANPYKIVVLGAGAVGKSSVTLRFVTGTFATEYVPTVGAASRRRRRRKGVSERLLPCVCVHTCERVWAREGARSASARAQIEDCYRKNTLVDDRTAYLDILDTAGQEEYTMLRDQWIRGGHGFLLVYSVNNRRSFEEIGDFRDRVLQVKEAETAPMVLVGNKCDLAAERTVTFQEGKSLADKCVATREAGAVALLTRARAPLAFRVVAQIRNALPRVQRADGAQLRRRVPRHGARNPRPRGARKQAQGGAAAAEEALELLRHLVGAERRVAAKETSLCSLPAAARARVTLSRCPPRAAA